MASTADFKNGMCIEYKNGIYAITQFQHVKPGKGPAFVRTKLKNVKTGKVLDNTFSAGEKVTVARVERRPHQFLYKEGEDFVVMHTETFEQTNITPDQIANHELMKEGQDIEVVVHADTETILFAELPPFVELEITYTEPGVKGDTSSTSSLKQAEVETGATVMVPLFIDQGEKIKIDTRDKSYSERVKG
jgi:elongation factor P